ncbi:hypothetical protein [Micromonospora sp. DH14]|uniref:hypothetical protein n=1 Tax=Micromonospora sp. DH14 TaxID=3040120 RepID=UPI0024429F2B|nr:hypothetical protein [Micromonospora sp. DH14]MDG9677920.1 hypothetical protein [Micromonospora sp. DH14]
MTLIGSSGHQDIPAASIDYVSSGVLREIKLTPRPLIGITSLAAGADQLFARLVLANGGELRVIIPSENYETTFSTPEEQQQYLQLRGKATQVTVLQHPRPSEQAYLDAGREIARLADYLIAVWDGKPARGKGGTADIVNYAQQLGKPVVVVWPDGVQR